MTRQLSRIEKEVAAVLKDEFRRGHTTRKMATASVMARLLKGHSVDDWIPPAEKIMLLRSKVDGIVGNQFKTSLKDVSDIRKLHVPKELQLGRINVWVALGEGPGAVWVPAIKATPEQWQQNYLMKRHKRQQLQGAERIPLDIKLWLEDKGYSCLGDAQ